MERSRRVLAVALAAALAAVAVAVAGAGAVEGPRAVAAGGALAKTSRTFWNDLVSARGLFALGWRTAVTPQRWHRRP